MGACCGCAGPARARAAARSLAAALPCLRCPVCGAVLALDGPCVRCQAGHSYDVAREGYVNLASGRARAGTADTAAMVAARVRFLAAGHYAPIADALAAAAGAAAPGPAAVLDLAGGTGYYLAAVLESLPGRVGICLDVSRAALRRAARAHPRAAAVGADVWRPLPVADGSAAAVLSVFGPRNPPEIARVLAPGGVLLVVTPTARHLRELITPLGLLSVDAAKPGRLAASLRGLRLVREQALTYRAALRHDEVVDLAAMGPSARHVSAAGLASRAGALPEPAGVTISVRVAEYRAEPL